MAEPQRKHMTYAAYLAAEEVSETKHEYLRGEVYDRPISPPEHAALTAAVMTELGLALRNRRCQVYGPDLRVHIEAVDFIGYPDGSVVCESLQTSSIDRNAITNPILIVEVLSDSTEAYDRGENFPTTAAYRASASTCCSLSTSRESSPTARTPRACGSSPKPG